MSLFFIKLGLVNLAYNLCHYGLHQNILGTMLFLIMFACSTIDLYPLVHGSLMDEAFLWLGSLSSSSRSPLTLLEIGMSLFGFVRLCSQHNLHCTPLLLQQLKWKHFGIFFERTCPYALLPHAKTF